MKKLLLLTALLLLAIPCLAADVTFKWDYADGTTPDVSPAVGFEIRIAYASPSASVVNAPFVMLQDCPGGSTRSCKVAGIPKGNYVATCYAYAVDDLGKTYSEPSNELAFKIAVAPTRPTNLTIP